MGELYLSVSRDEQPCLFLLYYIGVVVVVLVGEGYAMNLDKGLARFTGVAYNA